MNVFRKDLPRCQYGVWSPSIHGDTEDCGEPAVAVWNWGHNNLHVCADHDEIVWEAEESDGVYDRTPAKLTTKNTN